MPPATSVEPSPVDEKVAAPPPQHFDRLLLLAPGGPLILEFDIQVGGQNLADAFAEIVEQALIAADADADGRPRWSEVLESPRFKAGEFGNLPFNTAAEQKQITEKYDQDKDGGVDRDEVPRFLTRNAGGSRPFSFRGTTEWRYKNSRGSPLWLQIDRDHDGVLSSAEVEESAAMMRMRDDNEDEVLTAAELQSGAAEGAMTTNMPRRLRGIQAGFVLGSFTDWTTVRLALEQHYALGGNLARENFSWPQMFDYLDENGNGKIDRGEITRLETCPAVLRLRLELDADGSREKVWSVAWRDEDCPLIVDVRQVPGGLMLDLAGSQVKLVLNDTVGGSNYEQQAEQLVMQYDGDANGYIEKEEVPEAAGAAFSFEAADENKDGKVYPAEVAALLKRQQGAMRCQVHVKGNDRDDAFFAWLDENSNERLEAREIDAAAGRIQAMLPGEDEAAGVHGDQIPGSMLLVFARGSLENAEALFTPPQVVEGPAANRPGWFLGMDTNRDGVLSKREFVGEEPQFAAWDENGDGYLTWEEIQTQVPEEKEVETTNDTP